ncbi:hypothetical protein ACWEP4_35310 [Streptomyces sp. NPDC004227]
MDFTPVRNGMDYLAKAVDDLTGGASPPSERDLKYAVLHRQAATEVLLKARLLGEHWSLVYKDPGIANLEDFQKPPSVPPSQSAAKALGGPGQRPRSRQPCHLNGAT